MKAAIGSDHAGYDLKQFLLKELALREYDVIDCGTDSEESVDYPDFARAVCDRILSNEADLGIVICGTGIGVSISANKIHGIRAALCHTEFSARLARLHNDSNVLALGGRVLGRDLALEIADAYLAENFSGGERHKNRIRKMMELENPKC